MTVAEVISILENRVAALQKARACLADQGDLAGVADIDNQVTETEATLAALRTIAP